MVPSLGGKSVTKETDNAEEPIYGSTDHRNSAKHELGLPPADVGPEHERSSATFYKWKAKHGGLDITDARKLKPLAIENGRLKRMLADAMLDNVVLKDLMGITSEARRKRNAAWKAMARQNISQRRPSRLVSVDS